MRLAISECFAAIAVLSLGASPSQAQPAPDHPVITVRGHTYTPRSILARNMGSEEDQTAQFPPHKIIGNIYYVGTRTLSSFLVVTPQGNILIDSTYERNVPTIEKSVKELGFRFSDIKIVLGNHAHGDHQEGDALVKQMTGAQVMTMAEDVPALQAIKPGGKDHPIDRVLHDGDSVTLGGTTLVAHLTPGHTRGCITWTTTAQEGGKTYHVVINGSLRSPAVLTPAIVEEFNRSFKLVRSLPCDVQLGDHTAQYNMQEKYAKLQKGGPNPFIDPAGCRVEVDIEEAMFHAIRNEQKDPPTSVIKPSSKNWTPARTPDGQPDLQGTWTNATITPFERPKEFEGKPVLTEEESAELERRAAENRVDRAPREGEVGDYNRLWMDSGTKIVATRQSSLVVDPPDGRVPLSPDGEAQRNYNLSHNTESYKFMSPWDRCITRGLPGGMFPAGYNNAYQIVQTPGYVVIVSEMIHESRIIPLGSRQHLPQNIRQWNGDSIGHWEGDTLVVDTTNYNGKGWMTTSAASGRIKGVPQSQALHVVEHFARIAPDTISYEVTIDDPSVYTRSWKVAIPLARDDKYQIYEYACHEGNEAVGLVLRGGRALDKSR